jgi:hypothetical protein
MFCHFFHNIYDGELIIVFYDPFVQGSDHILDDSKLVEKFTTSIQHLVRENVLFSVHPKVGESFLSRVENFSQVAKCSFLVENFVSFTELVSVVSSLEISLEYFAQSLNLI